VFGFLALVLAAGLVLDPLVEWINPAFANSDEGSTVIQCVAILAGTTMALRLLERDRGWSWVWMGREAAAPRPVGAGLLLGWAAIGIPCLVLWLMGWMRLVPQPDGSWWMVALRAAALLLPAALLEELLMRGYLLAVLREGVGALAALALTSVAFGALHWWNPGATVQSLALVSLAGIFLGGIVLVFRSLYAAWAAHFAWNFVMAALLHAPVSGIALGTPDYRLADTGPDWATGGPWGPEGGAGAMLGMLGGLTYLFARRARRGE
jgi:membrane protease YdiL (CAAX protease family)